MTCQEKLEALGLSPDKASAALHYLADHLAHHVKPNPEGLDMYQQAFRCGLHACCDELRRQGGDDVHTAVVALAVVPPAPVPAAA